MASQILANMTGGPLDGTRQLVPPPPSVFVHHYTDEHGQTWQTTYHWQTQPGDLPTQMIAIDPPEPVD